MIRVDVRHYRSREDKDKSGHGPDTKTYRRPQNKPNRKKVGTTPRRTVGRKINRIEKNVGTKSRVEVDSNTSTVALRVIEATKREPSARGYNWATLFLGDINTGTWPSRLGGVSNESNIWSRVLRDLDPRVTALARPRSNCTINYRPVPLSERAPHSKNPATVKTVKNKIWSWALDGYPPLRQTGQLTVGQQHNFNLKSEQLCSQSSVSTKQWQWLADNQWPWDEIGDIR
jgi:hypothetical protein